MLEASYKIVALFLAVSVACAPALCSCAAPPQQIAPDSHGCCKHTPDAPNPAPIEGHEHSDSCGHCNRTLNAAIVDLGQQPIHSLDATCEFPSAVLTSLSPFELPAPVSFLSDTPPPLLLDLFHIRTSLLN